ncbi:MAG: hypothetical protein ABI140_20685 [Jatrophihabitantaceae bacterium]
MAAVPPVFNPARDAKAMSANCTVPNCQLPADGWFMLAPGCLHEGVWPPYESADRHPQPLCHWHSLIMGDIRVQAPAAGTTW